MGSSTSNMLVDAPEVLEKLFANAPCCLIATQCEDEGTIRKNVEFYKNNTPGDGG